MERPDFEAARRYALDRLERELPVTLLYHSVAHTRDDVAPAAERLATLAGIGGEERVLLLSAAWFHDIGYIEQREGHEAISARIAGQVLPGFGYQPEQIRLICGAIQATKLPQTPANPLEALLDDADLDVLGREEDFFRLDQALRDEMANYGSVFTDLEWYTSKLRFLEEHHYFTEAAIALRQAGKQRNIQLIRARLGLR